ncbi:MAG: hypothetical protein AB7E81_17470 [Hyphomicrobiaceae bacterium]
MADTTSIPGSPFEGGDLTEMRLELDALTQSQHQLNLALEGGDRLGRQFGHTLTTAFIGLTVQGKSFSNVLSTLALSLSKTAIGAAFKPLETAFGSALQSIIAAPSPVSGAAISTPAALSFGSSLFGGNGFASTASAGQDLAAPLSGAVSGGSNIVFNVTTPDVQSFHNSQSQIAALLARAVAQGQRNL